MILGGKSYCAVLIFKNSHKYLYNQYIRHEMTLDSTEELVQGGRLFIEALFTIFISKPEYQGYMLT